MEKDSLTALETRNLKSVLLVHKQDVGRVALRPEALGENLFSCLFQHLEAVLLPRLTISFHLQSCQ